MDHQLRRDRLVARLTELEADALLVTSLPNIRYLTGFTGTNGQMVLGSSAAAFLTDGRYAEQSRHQAPDLNRVTYEGPSLPAIRAACESLGVSRLAFEVRAITFREWEELTQALSRVQLVPSDGEVERLRAVKDAEEMRMLEQAQEATDQAFEAILDRLAVGISERQAAHELELAMRHAGADGVGFELIVAFGENAAEPHHRPTHRSLEEGDVVKLDIGALWEGYHSDMTRTIAFGAPPPELRKIHDVVREAQQAGLDTVRAGARAADVDRAARAVVEDAGYGDAFPHGLGHGVGLEIHEGPWFRPTSDEVLPAGAIMTLEPGVYVPGLGGVRIEDMVEVTEDGCRAIPTATKELIEL